MRALAADLGWDLVTPPTANRVNPWPLNRAAYRARNAIERYFGRIEQLRGIACRYHKLANVYLNQILLACIHFMTKQSEQALASGPDHQRIVSGRGSGGALPRLTDAPSLDGASVHPARNGAAPGPAVNGHRLRPPTPPHLTRWKAIQQAQL